MVTRLEGDHLTVLHADGGENGPAAGTVLAWNGTHCSRMVADGVPCVAPATAAVPAYAAVPVDQSFPVGAYAGVPLLDTRGVLLGTLCAFDPEPQPDAVTDALPTIALVGRMLSHVIQSEQLRAEASDRARDAEAQALADPLTGLYNRRGWARRLATEESRTLRYEHPACVLAVDIDGLKQVNDRQGHAAGDAVLHRAAEAMRGALRDQDLVARVGGDEFLILGVACEPDGARGVRDRVTAALAEADVRASVGLARHRPDETLAATAERADAAMYAHKQSRSND